MKNNKINSNKKRYENKRNKGYYINYFSSYNNNGTLKGTVAGYTGNVNINIRNGYTANSELINGCYVITLK